MNDGGHYTNYARKSHFLQVTKQLRLACEAGITRGIMVQQSPIDDPEYAKFAWARYRRLMKAMGLFTTTAVIAVLAYFYFRDGMVSIHFFIATALGIGVMMMLTAALMGLVFLSSGSGHDEAIENPLDDDDWLDEDPKS